MSLKVEGHLTSKSSPLAPVSCKLSKQFIVQQHLNAHYKNISKAKSSIDNKCPKSWYKHVNVKDQIKKERLIKSARENARDHQSMTYMSKTYRSESLDDTNLLNNDKAPVDFVKPLGPRIYQKDVKSKIAQLRCYNAPKKRVVVKSASAPKMDAVPIQEAPPENMEPIKIESSRNELLNSYSEEDPRYYYFCDDVTRDILINNIVTNKGINQIFDEHIQKNKYNLKMDDMLRAYDNIRKDLESTNYPSNTEREMRNSYDFNFEAFNKPIQTESHYNENHFDYFNKPEIDLGDSFHLAGDNISIQESYKVAPNENEDKSYLLSRKKDEFVPDKHSESEIMPRFKQTEFSTAPSALQFSLTSTDDFEGTNSRLNVQNSLEQNMKALTEKIDNIHLKDSTLETPAENPDTGLDKKSQQSEDINQNKNVHFANRNDEYSAEENDDHSLTDVTSMKLEESEEYEENNDSTCVESSLDFNNTLKSELLKHDANVEKYEDDFDD